MPYLNIVVPVLNEQTLISELLHRISLNAEKITVDYEIIIVDDGSLDGTWQEIINQMKLNSRIKAIKFTRNFGHHFAISAGLKYSDASWVVVMDGDLQDKPEIIPLLYMKAIEGYDVVFVSRINRPERITYLFIQKIFYFILNLLSGLKFDSQKANYSIISKKVVDNFNQLPETSRFYGSYIKWLGFKETTIFADHGRRFSGKSSYSLKKRFKLALEVIISFSDRPLWLSIYLGLFLSVISFISVIYVLIRSLTTGFSVSGWASLVIVTFLIGGTILSVLGILGVYLSRIYREVKRRPLFIIDEVK